ncbi:arsenate reductase [Noviherbaspirillum humi]|uniref:Arsenate reductase n=1 Tax=Noviherbaspirillum humi TaxID=1688639 RepID=A0A239D9L4_9BURK|nr:arsenate reductase (glutaredoxin) [Noviherbaspirillum humi]SNS28989.1 arsenate reductase [Noviherbaspirillum humi]
MGVTIYHNPNCSTSRKTLEAIREAGVEPQVVEYLKTPPDRETLRKMIAEAGLTVREAARDKEALFRTLGLDNPAVGDEQLLDAMMAHPILINRPIVVTEKGTRLCRPAEKLFEVLPK